MEMDILEKEDNLTPIQLTPEQLRNLKIVQARMAKGMAAILAKTAAPPPPEILPTSSESIDGPKYPDSGCSGCPMAAKLKFVGFALLAVGLFAGYLYFKTPDSPCLVAIPDPQ